MTSASTEKKQELKIIHSFYLAHAMYLKKKQTKK